MYGLQEHEMRFYCLFKKVYFSLLATSDFFCRHAYAYAHMRIIRHESDMAAYAWPSLVETAVPMFHCFQGPPPFGLTLIGLPPIGLPPIGLPPIGLTPNWTAPQDFIWAK